MVKSPLLDVKIPSSALNELAFERFQQHGDKVALVSCDFDQYSFSGCYQKNEAFNDLHTFVLKVLNFTSKSELTNQH